MTNKIDLLPLTSSTTPQNTECVINNGSILIGIGLLLFLLSVVKYFLSNNHLIYLPGNSTKQSQCRTCIPSICCCFQYFFQNIQSRNDEKYEFRSVKLFVSLVIFMVQCHVTIQMQCYACLYLDANRIWSYDQPMMDFAWQSQTNCIDTNGTGPCYGGKSN